MEWIDVNDRLPEFGNYLVAYQNPSDINKRFYVITSWMVRGKWYYDNSGIEPAEDQTLKITHWMPLPEPPKK